MRWFRINILGTFIVIKERNCFNMALRKFVIKLLISKARYGFEIDWFVFQIVYLIEVTALLGAVMYCFPIDLAVLIWPKNNSQQWLPFIIKRCVHKVNLHECLTHSIRIWTVFFEIRTTFLYGFPYITFPIFFIILIRLVWATILGLLILLLFDNF